MTQAAARQDAVDLILDVRSSSDAFSNSDVLCFIQN
jgi:hypothetical protein